MDDLITRRDQIHEWMQYQEWEKVDDAWWSVMDSLPLPLEFHEPLVARLVRRKFFDQLKNLYGLLFEEMHDRGFHADVVDIVRMILRWKPPDVEFVREPLRRALLGVHNDRPAERIRKYFEVCGLNDPNVRMHVALARFETLVGVSRGQVFRHPRWGLGVVSRLDPDTEKVEIDFAGKSGQVFTIQGVQEFLQAIPTDSFVAEMVRNAEGLRRRLDEDPVEMTKFALRSFDGRLKVSDFKKILLEGALDEAGWRSWWGRARDAIRIDPWIDMEGQASRLELILRAEPRSFTEEAMTALRGAENTEALHETLREISRHQDEAPLTAEQKAEVEAILRGRLAAAPANDAVTRLAIGYIWKEFPAVAPGNPEACGWDERALLGADKDADTIVKRILGLPILDLQTTACEGVRRHCPDTWADRLGRLLPESSSRLAAHIERMFTASGQQAARARAIDAVLSYPERNPDLFLWAIRNVFDGAFAGVAEGLPKVGMLLELLDVLEEQYTLQESGGKAAAAEARALVVRFRGFMNDTNHKYVRLAVKECSLEEARTLLSRIRLNSGLSHMTKDECEMIIFSTHPDLKRQSRAEVEEETRKPSYHYCTREALEAVRIRLGHILNVEIPENSRQIGLARDHGDLRENAEYHAAKERQKLLHEQAGELNDLIGRAKVIEAEHVKTDSVGFGTRLKARDCDTNEIVMFTILGMWEAKPAENILSYMTPMGQAFMGKKCGEHAEIGSASGVKRDLEILEIEKAI